MATIGHITVRIKIDTEPLEIMRAYHLQAAERIREAIEQLSECDRKGNEDQPEV
jgi:hypothetical protein